MRYTILALMFFLLSATSMAVAADFVLITDPANPAAAINEKEAKNIYLGKKTVWDDGRHVTVFTQSASAVHILFLKDVLGKTTQQYATYWKKSLFTGTGLPPKDFATDAEVKAAVAAQPGSIGYIAPASLDTSVKALTLR